MENTFEELKARCKAARTTLNKVCIAAGISRSTVWSWKKNNPQQIDMYKRLLAEIDRQSNTSTDAGTEAVSA